MASKNPCGKKRTSENPYEVWKSRDGSWTWKVLKKNQSPEQEAKNPNASWFCQVITPMTGASGDWGDTYVKDVKNNAILVEVDGKPV